MRPTMGEKSPLRQVKSPSHSLANVRDNPPMDMHDKENEGNARLIAFIQSRLDATGKSAAKTSTDAGFDRTFIRDIFNGRKGSVRGDNAVRLAEELKCSVEDLLNASDPFGEHSSKMMVGASDHPQSELEAGKGHLDRHSRSNSDQVIVPEIDIRAGMGNGGEGLIDYTPDSNGEMQATDAALGYWELPESFIYGELRVRPENLRFVNVEGDSMAPALMPNDKVLVDVGNRIPSQPGVFCLWDGIGVVIKKVEYISEADPPRFRISSINQEYRVYERTVEEANIIGRVVWFGRRM